MAKPSPQNPPPAGPQLSVKPNAAVPIRIVYQDDNVFVVCKPAGVVTQPGEGHDRDSVLNGLYAIDGPGLQNLGKHRDYGLLHRLDRPTGGLLVVARTIVAYDSLREQFAKRKVKKTYVALIHGMLVPASGIERTPIREERSGSGLKLARVAEHPHAQVAVTHYNTLVHTRTVALVECQPETGRLHQIRAHLAFKGCAIVGDRDYGPRQPLDADFDKVVRRSVFLWSSILTFLHPVNGKIMTFHEGLPVSYLRFLDGVGITCPRKFRGDA
ncbi:MAG: RluA family pseudouridine synthase [Myxococcales bacterium]|nr:RluA family pseudouridine synthase [Myxococcales bacterium]